MSHRDLLTLKKALQRTHPDKGGDIASFLAVLTEYNKRKRQVTKSCTQCVKGFITERYGAFVRKVPCPKCWENK